MIKPLILIALLASGAPAISAGTGPEIAYVKGGSFAEIYLVNPDGTALRRLYRSPQRKRLFALDMKPGGGELAFEETDCCSSGGSVLKIIRYDNAGTPIGQPATLSTCRIGAIDYHPGGAELLYSDVCSGRTRRLVTATMASSDAGLAHNSIKASWRGTTEIVYSALDQIWIAPLANPAAAAVVATVPVVVGMDVSTSGALDLISDADSGAIQLLNLNSGALTARWQIGHYGHFSPDDQRVVYTTGYDVKGQYVMIRRTDGAGAPFRLAGSAAFGPVDWRN